jgi:hypothetical protein
MLSTVARRRRDVDIIEQSVEPACRYMGVDIIEQSVE